MLRCRASWGIGDIPDLTLGLLPIRARTLIPRIGTESWQREPRVEDEVLEQNPHSAATRASSAVGTIRA
jgi:hypothetical protein